MILSCKFMKIVFCIAKGKLGEMSLNINPLFDIQFKRK